MENTTFTLPTRDGLSLFGYIWLPEVAPKAIVQIQHGLAEHAGRYERFARALTSEGYAVYAADARGSGKSAAGEYGDFGPDGWSGWVDDVFRLTTFIKQSHPGLPLIIFGHSMGSFATQQFLLDHSELADAVILSGTTDAAGIVSALTSGGEADLAAFNAPFEHRTGFEWLSRDPAEVDAYVADPANGWSAPPPKGIEHLAVASEVERVQAIKKTLPILVISGDHDPVAGSQALGPQAVAARYQHVGLNDVELKLYPEARHEILNEINRDEVTADIIDFISRHNL
ncbi:alpha/beta hydrolase [Corynebacterium sp. ES2715-CONJ3]|uniref:alpha/beta hydrolase n=1 Tax=Corynebacterium sp. ES2715-CONJ3 TaxID=2974028 RepID=UPI0021681697|nr:alpha/beta hydrolase [Corynebacterium sp. ES2715-CONJ3]MCS4491720.1 alpha/beta hydrolase [Corynebacterium sp. ES2715-CONJ3]